MSGTLATIFERIGHYFYGNENENNGAFVHHPLTPINTAAAVSSSEAYGYPPSTSREQLLFARSATITAADDVIAGDKSRFWRTKQNNYVSRSANQDVNSSSLRIHHHNNHNNTINNTIYVGWPSGRDAANASSSASDEHYPAKDVYRLLSASTFSAAATDARTPSLATRFTSSSAAAAVSTLLEDHHQRVFVNVAEFDDNANLMQYSYPPSTNYWRVEYVAHFYVIPCLLTIGLLNQCLNVLTLNRLKSAGYLYLKASAIADILSVFAFIPFCLRHGNRHNPYDHTSMYFHAHVELPLINSLITASTFCLVAMTIDRYLSINYPIRFFNADSRTRIQYTIVVIYIIAFALFIPTAYQHKLIPFVELARLSPFNDIGANGRRTFWKIGRNYWVTQSNAFRTYLMFREVIARIGPIVVLVVLNLLMIRSLRRITARNNTRRVVQTEASRIRDADRVRIFILLLITSATFVICTFPASLLSLFIHTAGDGIHMQIFRAFANCLQVSHFAFNFYLYALCSSEYRNALYNLLRIRQQISPGGGGAQATGETVTSRLSGTFMKQVRTLRFYQYKRGLKVPAESGETHDDIVVSILTK